MMRSFLLAAGIFVFLIGAQCFAVEKFVFKEDAPVSAQQADPATKDGKVVMVPADWVPWSLLSTGTIISLFALNTSGDKG